MKFRKYFFNSSWMLIEQILRIFSGIIIGVYIARSLGPEQYGVLNYILAITTLMLAITRLGLDGVLVREFIENTAITKKIFGTALRMNFGAAIIVYALSILFFALLDENTEIRIYIMVLGFSVFFVSFQVIDYYFQSKIKAKIPVICKSITLSITSVLKIYFVAIDAALFWFVFSFMLDHFILSVILIIANKVYGGVSRLGEFSLGQCKLFWKSAWPLLLGGIAIQIYMRIDQVMIRNILDLKEVGLYSAATRFYEGWAIVIAVVTMSLLPAIIKARQLDSQIYYQRLEQLLGLAIWSSIFISTVMIFSGEYLVILVFGAEYQAASGVVSLIMWTSVFAAMGSVSARYFIAEGMEKKFAFRTSVGALSNIVLNAILIPHYGIKGAAISTLVCTLISNYMLDYFDPDLQPLLRAKNRAIFLKPIYGKR